MSLYTDLLAAGVPLDNHESDLYAKRTPEAVSIVNAAYHRGDIKTVSTFKSDIDGEMWFEIPFAFDPFWEKRGCAT